MPTKSDNGFQSGTQTVDPPAPAARDEAGVRAQDEPRGIALSGRDSRAEGAAVEERVAEAGAQNETATKPAPSRAGKLERLRRAVRRADTSTPKQALGLVLLVAGAVTLAVSGYKLFFPPGPKCPSQPATFRGVPATNPAMTKGQVMTLLRTYSAAYSQHDLNAIKDLLSPDACRYPGGGGAPAARPAALDVYRKQFDMQAHSKPPHPTVKYKLDPPRVVLGAGGRHEALVATGYHIDAGKDSLGSGKIQIHVTERGDKLVIDQIVIG